MAQTISEELLRELTAALERDPRINLHKWPISVWSQEGKMVLDGKMENIAAKRAALAAAQKLCRDKCPVVDLLRVAPTEPKGDLELRDALVKTFASEPVFKEYTLRATANGKTEVIHDASPGPYGIQLDVHNAAVRLSGRVGSLTHRRLAEVLAWWTGACEALDNLLEVFPPEEDHDNEITDAVRIVLEKDPLVHAHELCVGTAAGVVVLEGCADNAEEKRLAVLDAWCVPGVYDVVDRIEVCS